MEIVRARAEQAALLSQVAWEAKAAWRYPAQWLEKWRLVLTISPERIEANHYFVAGVGGQVVGFCGVHPAEPAWQLEHLWVRPEHWGSGVGRRLFCHMVNFARPSGAQAFAIDADPNAEGFYLRLGARRVGSLEAEIDGNIRVLPQLLYTVSAPVK